MRLEQLQIARTCMAKSGLAGLVSSHIVQQEAKVWAS